jgi:hypothetical protein
MLPLRLDVQGLMANLSTQMAAQLKDLIARLARYIDRYVGNCGQLQCRSLTVVKAILPSHKPSCPINTVGHTHATACWDDPWAYICLAPRLRDRPSELPEFVSYMEACWPHLEATSFKRQRVLALQENLSRLYTTLMEVSVCLT